jgi:hypothetical protein
MKKNISNKLAASMAVSMGALSMVGGVAPVFAAHTPVVGVSGEQADIQDLVGQIKATGITEEGVTVTAYQLVDGYYNDNNLIRYVQTDPVNGALANVEAVTAAEATAIANNIGNGSFAEQAHVMTKDANGDYVADVEPGLYLILVSGSTDTVFNPAIVAVNVADANDPVEVEAGEVSLTDFFNVNETNAYVKSSKSDMDKNIVDGEGADIGKGDTVAVGDVIHFQIDNMTIPSFSADYEAPKYVITDNLEAGKFAKIENLKVFINDVETNADSSTFILTQNDNDFVVSFSEAFLRAHAADAVRPTVKITYDSKLIDASGVNYAENYNHVKLEYSNNPADQTSMKEIVKNTYHYTFAIDGLLDGEAGDTPNDDVNKIEYAQKDGDTEAKRYELAGAKFAISMNEDMSDAFAEAESDAEGRFVFTGLDEGVYYIKEIDSPRGYTLNDNTYRVTISAELDSATGIMTEYSIVFESKASNGTEWAAAGSAVYTNTIADDAVAADGSVTNDLASAVTTADVVNTKIQSLPSTGGAGTAMAFGVSAVLAGTAGGIAVTAKKKARK